ncbi:SDR family NAD(P)-dependent oxidoreductase [Aliiruegeria sabulilitoris]|uniref:SDR family NAD(P)-dependent oxidoreductase n=1 Tax=Aliiruegeria sabulilitoris TaxID=1510458 RepID=UPI00082E8C41|nr:SDR family oxidoreductase [Aliiruegeria sabulilitoris]NDR55433.1 SDR family oxidoreductase [Pseudoruegeria sp. M32A2M]
MNVFASNLFKGKSAIVTGGTAGIGLDIAKSLSDLGASVIALGSTEERIAKLDEPSLILKRIDVRDKAEVRAFCAEQEQLDVLVNCAGTAKPEDEWEEEVFLDVMDVNLNSQMRFSIGLHDALAQTGGSVVNIASMLSYLADASIPAYTTSKTGVLGLTRACAHKWGPDGIRVNAVAPGYHITELTTGLWSDAAVTRSIERRTALGRWGTAQDVTGATLFLLSPAAEYITGTCLDVDGGFLSGNPLGD